MRKNPVMVLSLVVVAMLIVVMIFIPNSHSPPARTAKPPTQIYKEADYLAHLEVVLTRPFYGDETGQMSGFLINYKNQYYILTAGHIQINPWVIREIHVSFKNQPGIYSAEIYKSIFGIGQDYAVLKITDANFVFYGVLPKFGSSYDLEVGEEIFSLGSPRGIPFCLGIGHVMNLEYGREKDSSLFWNSVILHDATISHGNSGGPVVNKYGEVVGMNVGLHNGTSLYFAVRIENLLDWLENSQ